MPRKKKPELLWTRTDLVFGPEGVSQVSKPEPLIAAPSPVQAERLAKTPPQKRVSDYTVQELAREWGLSTDKIRQIFRNEPGVVKLRDKDFYKKRKRSYVTLRIPAEVAARVKQRLS